MKAFFQDGPNGRAPIPPEKRFPINALPIKSVTVNGKPWNQFDEQKEIVRLEGLKDAVAVRVNYLAARTVLTCKRRRLEKRVHSVALGLKPCNEQG